MRKEPKGMGGEREARLGKNALEGEWEGANKGGPRCRDPYGNVHMGQCAEECAAEFGFTREDQDEAALTAHQRALAAVPASQHVRFPPCSRIL